MQAVNRLIFGPSPEEKVRKWQQQLKQQSRSLDREIRQLDTASNKVKQQVRKLATQGDFKNAKLLAREVVRSNKQKDRLHTSQARLNSINMQLTHQLGRSASLVQPGRPFTWITDPLIHPAATVKITGTLQKSTEIMKLSNQLISQPQLSATMRAMSQEMMKAGIMQEMMDDTLDAIDDDEEELEEEAQEEVDKMLWQITDGKLGQANGKLGTLPQKTGPTPEEIQKDEEMERAIAGLLA
ncbi:BZ3500_MvSof-1268-A1-R1_Chr3-1g06052 [Microbotryum saponariae]|uniref:BZ3500_MvSof-1268-A1-R1_Chr3-1g06052 protein n=1 Tax=Microbotryum saponariae TaxID=289078 RepID=A0A2X0LDL8_9BASI|nr:BZ3500_MvSof-1268-A1-R1_Chr3-1g06052 [Microbotryum saponariae]SDA03869.1 BZ3501_MvSof-1269-A2-R1_Chr3-2g05737 [Microbotryum saponariae]